MSEQTLTEKPIGNYAKLREAMTTIQKIIKLDGDNEPQLALTLISEVVYAALAAPARICDKMNRHKAIWDCRNWLKMHGYRLTSKQDDIMCQTIWWLWDETKEAEVKYERT